MSEKNEKSGQSQPERARSVSAFEDVRACLRRLDAVNPEINAFLRVHREQVQEEARKLDASRKQGGAMGELACLPVAIKDNIDEAGRISSGGSAAYAERRPERDARVVELLRQAGALVVGRSNMHELANGVTCDNSYYGPVRNPWGPELTPGGSSGGSAAAVAAGIVDLALGTDTGGSVRIPASLCGVVGFKPTRALISTEGVMPLSTSLDHVGPLVRRVKDLGRVMRSLVPDLQGERFQESAGLGGLRLGVLDGFGLAPEAGMGACFDRTLAILEGAGVVLVGIGVPELELGLRTLAGIYPAEAFSFHESRLKEAPELFGEDLRRDLERGERQDPRQREKALSRQEQIERALRKAMADQDLDALVSPTTPATARPFPVAAPHEYLIYTCPFNFTGQPALSLPMGLVDGLPAGLQLVGLSGDDARLLAWGAAVEDLLGLELTPPIRAV